ncbi:hypothetical protein PPACK8108_LOCUS9746 [Phakopsora pachyrhizi]|uniref:Uncharacterized protein n=1 Tax=Phakopsora pachyrhizi TaxID=170000 RepID=A0AAV0B0C1_PHAPC|nr:hypothetical protein PPACK8108_LOCUS9746 [Phakopsora pachyrhizi]
MKLRDSALEQNPKLLYNLKDFCVEVLEADLNVFYSKVVEAEYCSQFNLWTLRTSAGNSKEEDKDKKSSFEVERSSVKPTDQKKNLYQSPFLKDSLSENATSSSKKRYFNEETSMSRRTSVAQSPFPTRIPSISARSTTDKRKKKSKSNETVTQVSSIKPRTEHE